MPSPPALFLALHPALHFASSPPCSLPYSTDSCLSSFLPSSLPCSLLSTLAWPFHSCLPSCLPDSLALCLSMTFCMFMPLHIPCTHPSTCPSPFPIPFHSTFASPCPRVRIDCESLGTSATRTFLIHTCKIHMPVVFSVRLVLKKHQTAHEMPNLSYHNWTPHPQIVRIQSLWQNHRSSITNAHTKCKLCLLHELSR